MNCLDCQSQQRVSPAVGVCTNCGAGVCGEHLELDTHTVTHYAGVGTSREYPTRAVTCAACGPVMTAMHHSKFKSGSQRTAAMQS